MTTEYEYSFETNKIDIIINYCVQNEYKKVSENYQTRKLFKSSSNVMGRLTFNKEDNKENIILDFKNNNENLNVVLKNNNESLPLEINNEDIDKVLSIFEILNLKLDKTLERKRIIYKKNNVIFEIDQYFKPFINNIVGIEGSKTEVDIVYKEIIKLIEL